MTEKQRIYADEARIAGSDYYEIRMSGPGNDHPPDEEEDRLSIESERHFQQRFHFSARPQARAWFLAFRDIHHLTIEEVRRLAKAGVFMAEPDLVRVTTSKTKWLLGWSAFVAALAIGLLAVVRIDSMHGNPWGTLAAQYWVMGIVSWLCWGAYNTSVWPYARLHRRRSA